MFKTKYILTKKKVKKYILHNSNQKALVIFPTALKICPDSEWVEHITPQQVTKL